VNSRLDEIGRNPARATDALKAGPSAGAHWRRDTGIGLPAHRSTLPELIAATLLLVRRKKQREASCRRILPRAESRR
jgi:hypothetical protein